MSQRWPRRESCGSQLDIPRGHWLFSVVGAGEPSRRQRIGSNPGSGEGDGLTPKRGPVENGDAVAVRRRGCRRPLRTLSRGSRGPAALAGGASGIAPGPRASHGHRRGARSAGRDVSLARVQPGSGSSDWSISLAGSGGGRAGRPMHVRLRFAASRSVTVAMICMPPPHPGHRSTSAAGTRLRRSAHAIRSGLRGSDAGSSMRSALLRHLPGRCGRATSRPAPASRDISRDAVSAQAPAPPAAR